MNLKNILFWWTPIFLITGLVVLYSYSETIFTIENYSVLSVFNLKNEEVKANNESLLLYDSVTFVGAPISKVTIGTEEFIVDSTIPKSMIQIKVVSDIPYCFFTADVTDYYLGLGDPQITAVHEENDNHLSLEVNPNKFMYLYPGLYNLEVIGATRVEKEIIGIYPVECSQKGDFKALESLVETYRFLVPEQERQLIDRVSL